MIHYIVTHNIASIAVAGLVIALLAAVVSYLAYRITHKESKASKAADKAEKERIRSTGKSMWIGWRNIISKKKDDTDGDEYW